MLKIKMVHHNSAVIHHIKRKDFVKHHTFIIFFFFPVFKSRVMPNQEPSSLVEVYLFSKFSLVSFSALYPAARFSCINITPKKWSWKIFIKIKKITQKAVNLHQWFPEWTVSLPPPLPRSTRIEAIKEW